MTFTNSRDLVTSPVDVSSRLKIAVQGHLNLQYMQCNGLNIASFMKLINRACRRLLRAKDCSAMVETKCICVDQYPD
jgi:hypothetical protein